MAHISVVSPVYSAENILPELISRIESSLLKITPNFEIILVNDGSKDDTWNKIESLASTRPHLKGINLSRNFGQHYAITCGLDHAHADWVVVMDCDLQDQPEEIVKLYKKALEGYDVVLASRKDRKDNTFKRIFSKYFYKTLGYLTGSQQDETVANFGIYNNKVIDSIKSLRESIRYFPTMVKWVGFKQTKIDVNHATSLYDKSNYDLKKSLSLALDIILAFSDKPIRLVIKLGFIISLISFIIGIYYTILWLNGGIIVLGYTSLIVSTWLLSGIILSTLGVIGLYVGKTFEGVKNRPIYIVDKITNE